MKKFTNIYNIPAKIVIIFFHFHWNNAHLHLIAKRKKAPRIPAPCRYTEGSTNISHLLLSNYTFLTLFDCDIITLLYFLLLFLLRNRQFQYAMFILCMNVFLGNSLTDIEASAHAAGITLTPDILAALLVLFVLIQTLCSLNCQVTISKLNLYFIFLESWEIHIYFV